MDEREKNVKTNSTLDVQYIREAVKDTNVEKLKKDEREYIHTKLENLDYINAQIQDEIEVGHEEDLTYWQEQYQKQFSKLDMYLKKKGIRLKRPISAKDKDNERAEAKEVHKKKCVVCRRHTKANERTRGLERIKE